MKYISVLLITLMLSTSCATMLTPKATEYQRTKPEKGEPARKLRWVCIALDLLIFPPFLIVDLLTKKIYKPEKAEKGAKDTETLLHRADLHYSI